MKLATTDPRTQAAIQSWETMIANLEARLEQQVTAAGETAAKLAQARATLKRQRTQGLVHARRLP